MSRTSLHHRLPPSLRRALPGALAAMALGFSLSSHAGGGEALDIELPSMRTPIEAAQIVATPTTESTASTAVVESTDLIATATPRAPLTRADVREALKTARMSNTMTPSGEIGDTTEVLQAREDFNALQTEVLQAEYAAAAQRDWELQQALRTSMNEQAVEADEQQIVVAPEMTVGELMSFLQDSRAEGTVVVTLPNDDESEAD